MKRYHLILPFIIFAMMSAQAQTFQSQQILQTSVQYKGTVYEPFDNTPPSEQYSEGISPSPNRAPGKGGGIRKGFDKPTDPGNQSQSYPIGEPWIMAIFAVIMAAVIAIKHQIKQRQQTAKNIMTMQNNNIKSESMWKGCITYVLRMFYVFTILFTIGIGDALAGYNWYGNVFFRAPDDWGDLTGKHVQLGLAQGTSTTDNVYVYFATEMDRVGTTRLYYKYLGVDHGTWAKEYVVFTMNTSNWATNTIKLNSCAGWTTPVDYGFANNDNPYLFNPSGNSNGASLSGSTSSTGSDYDKRRDNLLKKTQRANLYTNGTSSKTGGSVRIDGYYLTGNTSVATSNVTNGSNTYASYDAAIGTEVTLTATPAANYYFVGWYTESSGGDLVSNSNPYSYTCTGAKTVYARFEKRYSVTVNAGSNGTTTPAHGSTVTAGYYTTSGNISANPNGGYYLLNWTLPSGTSAASGYSNTSNPIQINATAASKTITANFAQRYILRGSEKDNDSNLGGMAGWGATDNSSYTSFSIEGNVMTITATLTLAKTRYKFKIFDRSNSSYKGQQNTSDIPSGKAWTLNGDKDVYLLTTAPGVYTFAYNFSTNSLTVTFPTTHTVTYGSSGTGGSITSVTNGGYSIGSSPGYAVSGTDVTFNQSPSTGYTFKGWYTSPTGNTTVGTMGVNDNVLNSISANANVYAQYTANTYKITFDATSNGGTITNNGSTYAEDGARKINATYDATVSGTMPTARKDGYYFKGWYTASSGGNCVINASGVWQYVDGYTTSTKKWHRASATTLYAQYGIPTITPTFTPNSVLPLEIVTVNPGFNHNPEGNHSLCYVLTTGDGDAMEVQPSFEAGDGYNVSFEAPVSPGQYSVEVRLYGEAIHDCGSIGSPITTYSSHSSKFTVEAANIVTVQYKCGSTEVKPSTVAYATATEISATVTAPEITGLTFTGWTKDAAISYTGGTNATSNPVQILSSGSATLTANYSQGPLFFKNTLGWSKVYVYFYNATDYWYQQSNASEGTGSSNSWSRGSGKFISGPHEMKVLDGTTDVYYYDGEIPATMRAVAFTRDEMKNYDYFSKSEADPAPVVRVTSFNSDKPMIVPVGDGAIWNLKKAKYYAHDEAPILMDWGFDLRGAFSNWTASKHKFKSAKLGDLSFTTTVYLDAASTYQWKLYNVNKGYGKTGTPTLTKTNPTSATLDNYDADGNNLRVQSNIPGEYTFTLNYGTASGASTGSAAPASSDGLIQHMTMTVTFPVVANDFRLMYTGGAKPHPSNVIKKRANGVDVVDLYVDADKAAYIKLQPCSSTSNSSVTWMALASCSAPSYKAGVDFAAILSAGGPGVYSFTIEQDANGANPKVTKVEKYTGRFYVRTNCVNDDKWNYKDSKDAHAMTYSEYSTTLTSPSKPYSHYFVKDIHGTDGSKVNIKFTVATDNSEAITDTVVNGDATGDYKDTYGNENLNRTANVRFTYNQATNKIWRAYTEGPTNDNYMLLKSNGSNVFKDNNGTKGVASGSIKFDDKNNWVYQIDVWANVGACVKLTAEMHDASGTAHTQYIKGINGNGADGIQWTTDDAVKLLASTTASNEHMRITYDFKTDRMITAWIPSGTISTDIDIDADVLLIRKHQEAGQSITISSGHKLTNVNTVYGVMQFDKDFLNDVSRSVYSRDLFWISFPFDVKLSDVFGFGTYGQHWIIEYYDGKSRAAKGYWADSPGFWEFVMPDQRDTYVLKAHEGYVLALDLDELGESSNVWANSVTTIYLYFPSSTNIGDLEPIASLTVPVDQDGYRCTIDRSGLNGAGTNINENRTVADSYWHMIGAPSYANATRTGLGTTMPELNITDNVLYVYEWSPTTNRYTVHSTSSMTFDAMRSYMTQYNGANITWTSVSGHKSVVARRERNIEDIHFAEFKLSLQQGQDSVDQTYIRLSDEEDVTTDFDFCKDLTKEFNSGSSNIYTIISNYLPAAGNDLPLSSTETTIVPVGLNIVTAGDYTFSIPDGTNGVGITLIDEETGVRTSLSALDYTVELAAGDYTERFWLEISPVQQTPTDIEAVSDQPSELRKVLIDGILYIVKDGKLFDARGARLR